MKRFIFAAMLLAFILYALPVYASGIIIGSGGTIKLNDQTILMNCDDLTVEGGGSLNLGQGLIDSCRHFTLEQGAAFIDGSGEITLCGTWENNSTFQKNSISTISFVPGCGVGHKVKGSGDTDNDSVSDMREGFNDANDDGIPDFLDSSLTAVYWAPPAAIQMLLLLDNDE